MKAKLKLLAAVGTVTLGAWIYYDFVDTDSTREAVKKQVEPFVIVEDGTFEKTVDNLLKKPEEKDSEPIAPVDKNGTVIPIRKSALIPQGPLYDKEAPSPVFPKDSKAVKAITLDDALAAAIDGSDEALQLLQDFFDKKDGVPEEIGERASEMLSALGKMPLDSAALEQAARRVIDAAARSATSAYAMPFTSLSDFGLTAGDYGWDFGPDGKTPHRGFMRVGPKSNLISGKGLVALEASPENDFIKDGVLNVNKFGTTDVEAGTYRLYVVTTTLPSGGRLAYPFGRKFGFNGNELRVVDVGAGSSKRQAKLTSRGIVLESRPGEMDGETPLVPVTFGKEGEPEGWLITSLIQTNGEPVRLSFEKLGNEETYIVSIVISPTSLEEFENQLNEQLLAFLNDVAPAAGGPGHTRPFGNDFTAKTIAQFFTNPNTRSGLGSNASPVEAFSSGGGVRVIVIDTDTAASTGDYKLEANAIPEQTIYLGDDFDLNGCGSTLNEISLCDLFAGRQENELLLQQVEPELFDIRWILDGEELNIGDSSNPLVLSDVIKDNPELFMGAGSYEIVLSIVYEDGLSDTYEMILHIIRISLPPTLSLAIIGLLLIIRRKNLNK
ncbi:hypothetical protein [Emcibacter nanhaiensis]|uniref:Uncharacterized protein n=1 Tax=Emcibacter nanhaiensis TaxID=1505037 RepID=A0A501PJ53_9PROT|nr:hypothetical protein [Emcibacter nanhaiensis]TPD60031.1 hypothetical protein FIV46_09515 [Emcibacter nanhaiensis]